MGIERTREEEDELSRAVYEGAPHHITDDAVPESTSEEKKAKAVGKPKSKKRKGRSAENRNK